MSEIVPIARDSYRARILSTLDQEGMLTVAELSTRLGLTDRQVRDNAYKAKNEGLIVSLMDQETGKVAYRITTDGRKWVKKLVGMTALENQKKAVIQAIEAETDSPVADDGAGEPIPIIPDGAAVQTIDSPIGQEAAEPIRYATTTAEDKLIIFGSLTDAVDFAMETAQRQNQPQNVYRLIPVGAAKAVVQFVSA